MTTQIPTTGFLTDDMIRTLCLEQEMITPFVDLHEKQDQKDKITWGLSPASYDASLGTVFKRYRNLTTKIDPKSVNEDDFVTFTETEPFTIEPGGFLLGTTRETFRIPENIMGLCISRSTYARCFSGDTPIYLHDGKTITFKEAFNKQEAFREKHPDKACEFRGLALDEKTGQIRTAPLTTIQKTGTQPVVVVTYDDESQITCTPDHEFLVKNIVDGVWDGTASRIQAQHLESTHVPVEFRYHRCEARKIISVSEPQKAIETYCLTSPLYGNFLVGNGMCVGNCALMVHVTPLIPGFVGKVTLEISNTTQFPITLYPNEGICQFMFFHSSADCDQSYADIAGKYMNQEDTTGPRHI